VIAFRMKQLGNALQHLEPPRRALLDLSMRRDMPDEEIGEVLGVSAEEVAQRRVEVLEQLAAELRLETREQREELFATLPDLPSEYWGAGGGAQAARA
jgi:DNA-directed RNA polymerase specialized sigma24 family protein